MVLVGYEADGLSVPTWVIGEARLPSERPTRRHGQAGTSPTPWFERVAPTSQGPAGVGAEERCANLPRATSLHLRAKR